MAEVEMHTMAADKGQNETIAPVETVVKHAEPNDDEIIQSALGETADGHSIQDGAENPAFIHTTDEGSHSSEPVPMTFVEFLPRLITESASTQEAPIYAEFSTVLEQANQWLKGNQAYQVMKLETYVKKLLDKDELDADCVVYHESSHGINKYLKGLRLWLTPSLDPTAVPQQIGYLTVMPDPSDGNEVSAEAYNSVFHPARFRANTTAPSYCGQPDVMEKLNKFLKKKPLPGTILNVETIKIKYEDTDVKCLDTEKMCWADCGRTDRIYVYGTRIYYIIGKPTFETLCYYDVVPTCLNNFEPMARLRVTPFMSVVQRARQWLKIQKGIRVVNMQTLDVFCDRVRDGEAKFHSDKCGHAEPNATDLQFAKVLRIFYTQDSKSDVQPYELVDLNSRLFIPTRRGQYGKVYESFSKTMQRITAWLQLTKTPIFGMETVYYPFSPDSYGSGVKDDSAMSTLIANSGKFFIMTVRLYFPCDFEEPDPKLLPPVEEEEGWWACSVS